MVQRLEDVRWYINECQSILVLVVQRLEDVRWCIKEYQSEYYCRWFRDLKMLDDVLMNINHNTCVGGSETWRC